jgi:hypothetical protein
VDESWALLKANGLLFGESLMMILVDELTIFSKEDAFYT